MPANVDPTEYTCGWFARCENDATHFQPHPVLAAVPCCDRCREKLGLGDPVAVVLEEA